MGLKLNNAYVVYKDGSELIITRTGPTEYTLAGPDGAQTIFAPDFPMPGPMGQGLALNKLFKFLGVQQWLDDRIWHKSNGSSDPFLISPPGEIPHLPMIQYTYGIPLRWSSPGKTRNTCSTRIQIFLRDDPQGLQQSRAHPLERITGNLPGNSLVRWVPIHRGYSKGITLLWTHPPLNPVHFSR